MIAAKCRRLGGAFAAGFEPGVSNHLLSAIFECGLGIFQNPHLAILNATQTFLKDKNRPVLSFVFVFFLLIYITAKAQSKMAPDERFETLGSNSKYGDGAAVTFCAVNGSG